MIKLYNSLTRKLQDFNPINPGNVGVYSCGPTVYDHAHIGNLRAYLVSDLLHRVLTANGYKVRLVMNITDVDDKTIKKSQEEQLPLNEITENYTKLFLADLEKLNIIFPEILPRATQEIPSMVELIKILLDKGFAYKSDDGNIYFDISKLPNYGQIAQVDLSNLKTNADGRLVSTDEYEKEDVRDFALWKAHDESDGEIFWDTDIGKGRPGWHIECSAMATKYLGQPFDIHLGGIDLLFPHHTNEIAQSQAAHDSNLANYWLHTEHLLVDGAKMAKSKNNYYTATDLATKNVDILAFRYLIFSAHYRSKLNFSWESLTAAQNALNNLRIKVSAIKNIGELNQSYQNQFIQALNNDLSSPQALSVVWALMDDPAISDPDKLATLLEYDKILGFKLQEFWDTTQNIPSQVIELLAQRNHARDTKEYGESDRLRTELEQAGYIVEDTPNGTILKKS